MKKANRSMGRRGRGSAKCGIGSYRAAALHVKLRWLAVACATLACLGLFAARNGAEQVDSGWAVAIPSPLAKGATNTAEQELVIRHVLEQTRQPLLRKPESGQASSAKNGNTEGGLRFAERPEATSVDGWRRPVRRLGLQLIMSTAQSGAPQAGAANVPSKRNYEAECDCSGMSDAAARGKRDAARLPSASGPNLPQLPTPAVIEETPAANPSIEEASKDGEPESPPAEPNATTPRNRLTASRRRRRYSAGKRRCKARPQTAASAPTKLRRGHRRHRVRRLPKSPATDITPVSELPPLSRQLVSLKNRVRTVLKGYYRKALNSRENDPGKRCTACSPTACTAAFTRAVRAAS